MREERTTEWFGVRLLMISPVVAKPGQVLLYKWGGGEPDVIEVVEFDDQSRARILRTGGTTAPDDMALLEEQGVIARLRTKEQLKHYGYDMDRRQALQRSRQRARARQAFQMFDELQGIG